MHIVAIVLAIRTRKIDVKVVNDAKETQAIVYLSSLLIIFFVITNFTLEGFANGYGIAVGGSAYLEAVMFLCITFIPKVLLYTYNTKTYLPYTILKHSIYRSSSLIIYWSYLLRWLCSAKIPRERIYLALITHHDLKSQLLQLLFLTFEHLHNYTHETFHYCLKPDHTPLVSVIIIVV